MSKLVKKIKEFFNENTLKFWKNTGLVILGTFILAVAVELFIIPARLNTGGVSGIAMCFQYAGLTNEIFTTEVIITIVTTPWFIAFFVSCTIII